MTRKYTKICAMERNYSAIDRLIASIDEALRISTGEAPHPFRPNPAGDLEAAELDEEERRDVAGLMRINHTGEVCAQALYAGQAATARLPETREAMQSAADEEIDHLSWCEERLKELDSHPSLLNPLWYAGSFAIGAAAGIAGDEWSLGFVKETENQVEAHLEDHLGRLPDRDARSHAILDQMRIDEAKHADMAEEAGARELPPPVRRAMTFTANLMKALAYRI
ncbi:MAG: 2-polyprenyl-3-methyl-6-methoxy-1,4-benzoquinone monooxygenase [Xanthomonadales bacterium]|nr:2-polyprenyl-3-methyl-6-methoxy-1,4-benzoquinone monooxygenase [Xanthomonadales bacterium]NNK31815.1 2-polyprenyl-3-methyl-6-methoxy-1,4-benzoquinone monooxygenase [Xanthomonadales bacterium]